jgi:hypothetical protein
MLIATTVAIGKESPETQTKPFWPRPWSSVHDITYSGYRRLSLRGCILYRVQDIVYDVHCTVHENHLIKELQAGPQAGPLFLAGGKSGRCIRDKCQG